MSSYTILTPKVINYVVYLLGKLWLVGYTRFTWILHSSILTPSFQGFESYGDRAKYDGMERAWHATSSQGCMALVIPE
jgi:hypothetical protein